MGRVAYFGTQGCVGHYPLVISGLFTQEELREFNKVDCDSFYSYVTEYKPTMFRFGKYTAVGFPASPDDERGGSKTVVFFDGDVTPNEIINVLRNNPFLKSQFNKLFVKYKLTMRL